MNDMNFENIDKLIIEASKNVSQPAFDHEAWDKMDQLLDKEFGKKKRRFLFWWWLLPIALGGGLSAYYFTAMRPTPAANTSTVNTISKPTKETSENNFTKEDKTTTEQSSTNSNNLSTAAATQEKESTVLLQKSTTKNKTTSANHRTNNIKENVEFLPSESISKQQDQLKEEINKFPPIEKNKASLTSADQKESVQKSVATTEINSIETAENKKSNAIEKTNQAADTTSKNEAKTVVKKKEEKVPSKFFITAGSAIDASFVHINSIETAKVMAGIGFGYVINKRFALQTGFYAGHKIYSAKKQDYNLKNYNFPYANNIQNINADCYVYEVPLTLRYNVTNHRKSNWFTTAGISSLFMKTENYDVYYNYGPNTPTHMVKWAYADQNNHLFSILTMSFGYEATIRKNIFFSAEPYYKLPLGGVGEGEVKLSSLGLQLGVRYQFMKKKK
jgi:hypothetical protein